LVFVNSTMVTNLLARQDVDVIEVPASALAEELGDGRAANVVMLGAYVAATGLVALRTVETSLAEVFGSRKKDLVELNRMALQKGAESVKAAYPDRFRKKTKATAPA
jgi:2-oxoglutarate ferredoxin oxidoreductase subunit gamma